MKLKLLNAALIVTSVMAYLEWGQGNSMFLLTGEADIIKGLFTDPASVVHPFTLIPLAGQLMLLATLFQKHPGKVLTFLGMGCIAVLLLFIFAIGIMSLNIKIFASTLPFVVTCVLTVITHRKQRTTAQA
ncbi:MAG: hypothetical protein K0Q79_2571 [Flavipsychrobacter sp.]|jgi:cobalamin biosynthesis protein CobD/CbiB|nr:hypothetical protein [Flavipsychrobacter sp.]